MSLFSRFYIAHPSSPSFFFVFLVFKHPKRIEKERGREIDWGRVQPSISTYAYNCVVHLLVTFISHAASQKYTRIKTKTTTSSSKHTHTTLRLLSAKMNVSYTAYRMPQNWLYAFSFFTDVPFFSLLLHLLQQIQVVCAKCIKAFDFFSAKKNVEK